MQMNEINLAGALFAYLKFNGVKSFDILEFNTFIIDNLRKRKLFLDVDHEKVLKLGIAVYKNDGINVDNRSCQITLKSEDIYSILSKLNFQQQDDLNDLALSFKYRLPQSIDTQSFIELLLACLSKFHNSKSVVMLPIDYISRIKAVIDFDQKEKVFAKFLDYEVSTNQIVNELNKYNLTYDSDLNCYETPFTRAEKEKVMAKYNKETIKKMQQFILLFKNSAMLEPSQTLVKKIS